MPQQHPAIEVVGARTHNLKGIDCRIPHARVTVVTGLSGGRPEADAAAAPDHSASRRDTLSL